MQLRTLHAYVGMLIAPTVLFMAVTGFFQIFSLHEDHDGYHAPRVLEVLGSLHKDQKLPGAEGGHHDHDHEGPAPAKAGAPAGAHADADDDHGGDKQAPKRQWAIYALKWVFALAAIGLFGSTCVGIWRAWQSKLRRKTNMILLAVGVVLPLVLAFLAS